mmetsp:Transcript_90629/g.157063  ORF Transcript_90629/g.157063 Transcript_90629/m.157063 type:complete len:239 (-) Transcript_90629:28-744(-)
MGCCDSKQASDSRNPMVTSSSTSKAPETNGSKGPNAKSTVEEFDLHVKDDVPPASVSQHTAQKTPGKQSEAPKSVSITEPTDDKDQPDRAAIRRSLVAELKLNTERPIDDEQALDQTSQDYSFLIELMQTFRTQYEKQMADIVKWFESQSWEEFALEAHSLKGAAANLFIQQMRAVCFFCEKKGKSFRDRSEKGETITPAQVLQVEVALGILQETFCEYEKAMDVIIANAPPDHPAQA